MCCIHKFNAKHCQLFVNHFGIILLDLLIIHGDISNVNNITSHWFNILLLPLIFSGLFYLIVHGTSAGLSGPIITQVRAYAGLMATCAVRCGAGLTNNVAGRVRAPAGQ